MKTSKEGLDFLKKEENARLFNLEIAQKDTSSALKPSIFLNAKTGKRVIVFGYGSTNLAFPQIGQSNKSVFTLEEANSYLQDFVNKLEKAMVASNKFANSSFTDHQYDALISIAYSSGGESFFTRPENSGFISLVQRTLDGDIDASRKLRDLWPKFKIKDTSGALLIARRTREVELFFKNLQFATKTPLKTENNNNSQQPKKNEHIEGYFEYVHYNSQITSIQSLIKDQRWIDIDKSSQESFISPTKLLNLLNNRDLVRDRYDNNTLKNIKAGQEESYLAVGTILHIPYDCIGSNRVRFVANTFFHTQTNTNEFIIGATAKLLENTVIGTNQSNNVFLDREIAYKDREIAYKGSSINSQGGDDDLLKIYPKLTVWMYCKSLGKYIDGPLYSSDGELVNLTPFIQSIKTTYSKTGASWSLSLQPISCECSTDGWKLNKASFAEFKNYQETGFIESVRLQHTANKQFIRTNFLFHTIIKSNDVVFIRFDDFDSDSRRKAQKSFEFLVSPSQLPDNRYDMIGLVDSNSCIVNQEAASINISITGRDLMKLLLEDGSYWLNIPNFTPSLGIFKNGNFDPFSRTRSMRRFERSGVSKGNPYSIFDMIAPQRLGELIATIFASLASVEICPDSLFSSYQKSKISTHIKFNHDTKEIDKFNGAGIWSIIKVLQDQDVVNRYIIDKSIDYHQGSLLLGIQKYCQEPFVEFFGDTYGDQYYFIVRKPPFDYISFKALIDVAQSYGDLYTINADRVLRDTLTLNDEQAYCWYRINSSKIFEGVDVKPFDGSTYPAIYFPEYNEIWGNRAYDINSNYIDGLIGRENEKIQNQSLTPIKDQILTDLQFVIESNAYLPFTRKGSITIAGHKRIKRGTVLRYALTREVFYVDNVSLDWSIVGDKIEATTTYTVSRGMVYDNLEGQDILRLYFNVINFKSATPTQPPTTTIKEDVQILKVYFDTDKDTIIDVTLGSAVRLPLEIAGNERSSHTGLKEDDEQDHSKRILLHQQAEEEILKMANILIQDKTSQIEISGHTDKDASPAYNLQLSKKRADSIVKAILLKISAITNKSTVEVDSTYKNRLKSIGFGATKPLSYVYDQNNREVKKINRRIEAKIITTIEEKNTSSKEGESLNWSVNQDIFNFLLKGKQFCNSVDPLIFDKINDPSQPRFPSLDQIR